MLVLGLFLAAVELIAVAQPADRAMVRQAILAAEDARAPRAEDVQMLVRAAGGRDEALAAVAVRALGRLERPSLVADLLAFLEVRSPLVRAEASNAIGQAVSSAEGEPVERARSVLMSRLTTEADPRVRGVIGETLGRLPYTTPEAVGSVEAALVHASRQSGTGVTARPSATTSALGTPVAGVTIGFGDVDRDAPLPLLIGAAKGLESLIRQNIKTSPPGERTIARLRGLIATARPASAMPVTQAQAAEFARARRLAFEALNTASAADERTIVLGLQDDDPQVRRLAAQASGAARAMTLEKREALVARGLNDAQPMVRLEALRAYGRELQSTRGCGPVIQAIEDPDLHVALAAIDQLASGCPDAAAAVEALEDEVEALEAAGDRWHAAAHALVSLTRLAPERAASALPRFARHGVWQVRMYAARAAATLEDAATLERLASDRAANVREAAIAGLIKLKGHEADTFFLAALESQDCQLVRTAARALKGGPAREKATAALIAALARLTDEKRDTSRDPRMAILATLRELGSTGDAPALEPYLKDFDPRVAAEAASILTAWTGRTREAVTKQFAPPPAPVWADLAKLEGTRARVVMKGGGAFEIALFPSEAPATVDRFVRLARQGYYDGLTFHRVVPNFVIQGGSPGANEYMGDGPYMRDEVGLRPHGRGAVGVSTRGRDTGDAQIFINLVDNPRLDHGYTVFAEIVRGMDVVDRVREGDTIASVEIVSPPAAGR